jgi:uracil-DNA glycosylase
MLLRIEDFIKTYPCLLNPPPNTRAVATTREDNGFFPVFSGQFISRVAQPLPDVVIVGQDWGDAATAEDKSFNAESFTDSNFTNLRKWLGFSGLSLGQIFFTNMFLFVHSGQHTGNATVGAYSTMTKEYRSACLNVLCDTIRFVKAKVVIICGRKALDALVLCPEVTPPFRKYEKLTSELEDPSRWPFYIGQIADVQLKLFVCYHWSTNNRSANGFKKADQLWHSIGREAQGLPPS